MPKLIRPVAYPAQNFQPELTRSLHIFRVFAYSLLIGASIVVCLVTLSRSNTASYEKLEIYRNQFDVLEVLVSWNVRGAK